MRRTTSLSRSAYTVCGPCAPGLLQASPNAAEQSGVPLHLHIAEQQLEVDQCLASYGRRPVRWLLENFAVDRRWCLVHATHIDADESASLAGTGAVVCLCPSTEANLGDGLFPLQRFLDSGGRIAIGSDSHVSINPFEELRWLEYGQRLATQTRNVAALEHAHVGRELFARALDGGVRASGQGIAGIEPVHRLILSCSMTTTRCSSGTERSHCSMRWSSPGTGCRSIASWSMAIGGSSMAGL